MNPTWQTDDGRVKLWLGDCLDVLPTLAAGSVDAVVTDPPYGIGESSNAGRNSDKAAKTRHYDESDWDAGINQEAVNAFVAATKEAIVFGGNYYELPPARCWLVWDKLNTGQRADCELAWTNLDRAVRRIAHRWNGMIREGDDPRGVHPTQKPQAVMEWAIQWLRGGEVIVDPFMGSGTTGVACVRLGRKFLGVEKEPKYFEIAKRRIIAELERMPLFEEKPTYKQAELVG